MKYTLPILIVLISLVACTSSQPEQTSTRLPPTEAPPPTDTENPPTQSLEEDIVISGEVTFDGNECVLTGPSDLETGAHEFAVQNTTDDKGWVRICWASEGYTWQDILDHDFTDDDDVDEDLEWPSWCLGAPTSTVVGVDDDTIVHEYKIRHEGMYFVLWENHEPSLMWRCGPISVTKAEGN